EQEGQQTETEATGAPQKHHYTLNQQVGSITAVTFEPTTNNKGLSAYAVKVIPESKYIYIAGERLKLTSIKSYVVYREEEPVETRVDKENAVLSVGLLMNSIRPKATVQPGEMRSVKKLAITTFQGTTLIFSEDEIDIDATVKLLKV
ncbi:hypothetical protein M2B04_11185, partial [Klebsiella pneumoniae]|nr:hypothetical protein [Klebsiella pneumoniae]